MPLPEQEEVTKAWEEDNVKSLHRNRGGGSKVNFIEQCGGRGYVNKHSWEVKG